MLCEMAARDIEYLEGIGIKLTPYQIIKLNDLALKVMRGRSAADFIHAPRVAWIRGEHVLHEPTIAAANGWELTTPQSKENPDEGYIEWTFEATKAAASTEPA